MNFQKLIFLLSLFLCFALQANEEVKIKNVKHIKQLDIKSSINPATLNYLQSSFEKINKENKTDLILITLNTPGGLVTTTKEILTLFGSSDIPILIWIAPEGASATSAGAIMASASHFLFMGPGTNIGAATPIQMSGDIKKESDVRKKAVNDLVALIESLSEARGRNSAPFKEMVTKASSFSAEEALKKGLINGVASSKQEILEKLDGSSFTLKGKKYQLVIKTPKLVSAEVIQMDLGQRLLNIFANPSFAYILFLIGAALIYLELQAPGGFIAGSLGAVSLILAGIGFQVLPLNMGALLLIALAFVLFILETYITSYGIISLGGIVSLLSGSLFLFRTDDSYIHFPEYIVYGAVSAIAIFLLFILMVIVKDNQNSKREEFNSLEGKTGTILKFLIKESEARYLYQVKVGGEIWKSFSETPLEEQLPITVIEHKTKQMLLKIKQVS